VGFPEHSNEPLSDIEAGFFDPHSKSQILIKEQHEMKQAVLQLAM
jgi:hypothetical protein